MGAASEHVMAIDLGTGGPKVALVSLDGEVAACEHEPTGLRLIEGGGAEQDPSDWWRAIGAAWARVRRRTNVPSDRIVAVAVTAQWSGTVAVDAQGEPLHPAIIWMDSRGARYVDELTGGPIRVAGYGVGKLLRWLRLTGGAPGKSGKDPIAHLLWLAHERREVFERAHKFLEPKDWLNARLTGRFVASHDSIVLHWVTDNRDAAAVRYDSGLLRLSGLRREQLPDLVPATEVLGPLLPDVARELGLLPKTRVIAGTPDVQSAAIGSGGVADFDPHLYVGTSSWLTCHVPFKKTDIAHNVASLPSAIPGRWFVADEQETAGECVDFLLDRLLFPEDALAAAPRPSDAHARLFQAAARAEPGSGGLIFTPWLIGERTPVEDRRLRAAFFNVSLSSTREQLARAVLEGVAYNARWLLGHVERFCGRRFPAIRTIGGGARSQLWCQIFADVLGRPVRQMEDPVAANVRGVALLAAVGLGRLGFPDVPGKIPVAATFEPRASAAAVHERLFAEFLQLYRRTRRIYGRLHA